MFDMMRQTAGVFISPPKLGGARGGLNKRILRQIQRQIQRQILRRIRPPLARLCRLLPKGRKNPSYSGGEKKIHYLLIQ